MTQATALKNYILLSLLCAVITGCGFQLKGANTIEGALSQVSITGKDSYGDTGIAVKQAAERNAMELNAQAPWTIDLRSERISERRLTSTQSVSQDEFMLALEVTFFLHHRDAENDMTYGPIRVKRETIFQGDETQAASKDNEKQLLFSELRQQIATQVLRQTQIISNNPPDCNCEHETEKPTASE
ncbi:MAG: hypothetical protein HRU20_09895 [Pseudomonadales bacterium]|nr:hypothetical protein [Pseudomonadales bacterium]